MPAPLCELLLAPRMLHATSKRGLDAMERTADILVFRNVPNRKVPEKCSGSRSGYRNSISLYLLHAARFCSSMHLINDSPFNKMHNMR